MTSALISPQDLHQLLETSPETVAILDASYGIGASGLNPETVFAQMRIGPAQYFDIDVIADPASPMAHMLPSADDFADAVGKLGISNNHMVVVYDQTGIVNAASRAWWMFRVFGHTHVRVLNGGLPAWHAAGLPFTTGAPITLTAQPFTASFQPHLVKSYDDMRQIVESGTAIILDTRPPERFAGVGHMPGAYNVPAGAMINPASRGLHSTTDTLALFKSLNLSIDSPVVTSCGSGVTACVVALALHENGYENIAVYDGSWTEWGQQELSSPIVKGFE